MRASWRGVLLDAILPIADIAGSPEDASPTRIIVEGSAGHIFHHDEVDPIRRLDLVDRDDVRVTERGRRARLLNETAAAPLVGHAIGRQHLDGDVTFEPRVAGAIHLAHATGPDQANELVRTEPHADGKGHGRLPRREYTPLAARLCVLPPGLWLASRIAGVQPVL